MPKEFAKASSTPQEGVQSVMLVTAFAPYREALNASGALVASLRDALPDVLAPLAPRLAFEVIAVDDTSRASEHASLEAHLTTLLERHRPALCIHTGQAPSANKVVIERIGTNSFMREIIDPARPVAYWANLPGAEGLRAALEASDIPADYSFYAGQHLCNHILFSSRHFAETRGLPHASGFIHIPILPEQALRQHPDAPTMPLAMSRAALAFVIAHVAAALDAAAGSGDGV